MSLPPPLPDPAHIENRLLVVAKMLERAVEEVNRAIADVKSAVADPATRQAPDMSTTTTPNRSADVDY